MKVLFLLVCLRVAVGVLINHDTDSAAALVGGYGENFDANGAMAKHMHEAHLRGEKFDASTGVHATPDDMRPMVAMYAPEAMNIFMSASEDVEVFWLRFKQCHIQTHAAGPNPCCRIAPA